MALWVKRQSSAQHSQGTIPQREMGVTWRCVLKLFFLVVVNDNVCLHRDQFLLVKLSQVQQSEFIKLLVTEEHLWAAKPVNPQYRGAPWTRGS